MSGEGKLSIRAIVLAAAALGVIGMFLIFGGGPDEPAAASDPTPTGTSDESSNDAPDSHQHDHGDEPDPTATPSGGSLPTTLPTAFPTPGFTPEAPGWRPPPTSFPTSATGPPTEAPDDPHTHETPSPDEVADAPVPEFDHEFRVEVDQALAEQLVATAWAYVEPRLVSNSWSYLKLLESGVLEKSKLDGELFTVAVELGFSGVNGLGQIGVGRINTVWLQNDGQGGWMVTGYRDGALAQED